MQLKQLAILYNQLYNEVLHNNTLAAAYGAKFNALDRLRNGGGYSPLQEFYQVICQFHQRQALLLEHELHVIADLSDEALESFDRPVPLPSQAEKVKGLRDRYWGIGGATGL
jgi:hypothetical protein